MIATQSQTQTSPGFVAMRPAKKKMAATSKLQPWRVILPWPGGGNGSHHAIVLAASHDGALRKMRSEMLAVDADTDREALQFEAPELCNTCDSELKLLLEDGYKLTACQYDKVLELVKKFSQANDGEVKA